MVLVGEYFLFSLFEKFISIDIWKVHQFSFKIAFEKKILNDMFEEFMMYKI